MPILRAPALGLVCLASLVSLAPLLACGSGTPRSSYEDPPPAAADPAGSAPAPGTTGNFNPANPPPPAVNPADINEVYGHSSDTLFALDPVTKAVTEVGKFSGCDAVVDIALDESSNLFATSNTSLYTVDKKTAVCTQISTGTYPNSLSFVPKGTVDPNVEALVGYEDDQYVRIDTKTGAKTNIGSLGGGLKSSGDIVSVKGGKTYLTVKSTSGKTCTTNDCLVEVDPTSGAMVKNWGSIEHHNVFGLSFWGGKVYGFDDSGELFEVTFGTTQLATNAIAMPSKPAGLSFWGAGSSTSAPLVEPTK